MSGTVDYKPLQMSEIDRKTTQKTKGGFIKVRVWPQLVASLQRPPPLKKYYPMFGHCTVNKGKSCVLYQL